MPIRSEFRKFYLSPAWIEARNTRLAAANHRCERCGKADRALIWVVRDGTGRWSENGQMWHDDLGRVIAPPSNRSWHRIRCVLTVAHLDHDPPSIDQTRLRAWCQHCHIKYDVYAHRQQMRLMNERYAQQITLFEESTCA